MSSKIIHQVEPNLLPFPLFNKNSQSEDGGDYDISWDCEGGNYKKERFFNLC